MEGHNSDGLFYLKCNNFNKILSTQYELLRDEKTLTDITFVCEGRRIEAHKLILYACSPYFKGLIEEDLSQKHLVFFFTDVKYDIMRAIIDYMYIGEVHIQNDYLKDFIRVAENLKIRGLVKDIQSSASEKDGQSATDSESERVTQIEKRAKLDNAGPIHQTQRQASTTGDVRAVDETTTEATTNALCSLLAGKSGGEQLQGIEVEYSDPVGGESLMPLKSEETHWIDETLDDAHMNSSDTGGGGDDGTSNIIRKHQTRSISAGKRLSNCMTPMGCQTCGRVYSNASNLRQHIRLIHNPAPVICNICHKHYSSVLYLKRHYNAVHGSASHHKDNPTNEWKMFDQPKSN